MSPRQTRAVAAAEAETQRRAAAAALVANGDCWQLVGQAVLRTHSSKLYAQWRMASHACLSVWQENFEAEAPWLKIWPSGLERSIWKTHGEVSALWVQSSGWVNILSAAAGRLKLDNIQRNYQWSRGDMPQEWHQVCTRICRRFVHHTHMPLQRMPTTPPPAFKLADLRIHVALSRATVAVAATVADPVASALCFVGTKQLDQCTLSNWCPDELWWNSDEVVTDEGNLIAGQADAVKIVIENIADITTEVARMVPEGSFADGSFDGPAEAYGLLFEDVAVANVMLSRPDGAVASLGNQQLGELMYAAGPNCYRGDNLRLDIDGDRSLHLSFEIWLEELTEFGPEHEAWNEETMRARYDDERAAQRHQLREMREWDHEPEEPKSESGDSDDEPIDDDELEDLTAVMLGHMTLYFHWDQVDEDQVAIEFPWSEEELFAALMKLPWTKP